MTATSPRLYINGAEVAVSSDQNHALPTIDDGWYIGRRHDLAPTESMWRGDRRGAAVESRAHRRRDRRCLSQSAERTRGGPGRLLAA